jgi:hypothetical protein
MFRAGEPLKRPECAGLMDEAEHDVLGFTDAYNTIRPHSGVAFQTPWQRLNNLFGNDT